MHQQMREILLYVDRNSHRMIEESMSRRDFFKRAILAGAGIALGAYGLSRLLKDEPRVQEQMRSDSSLWKWSKEAYHYVKLGENVKCRVCPNECILSEGMRSVCGNKTNHQKTLYTLAYGNPCAAHIDPVEKKPLFHFLPDTLAFSIATAGCNFNCLNCQNWEMSQRMPEETLNMDMMPEVVVEEAVKNNCRSIAFTYTEPTAFFEYMYDISQIAQERNVKALWITNGYMNEEPLRDLCRYIDGANVDLKNFKEEIYNELNAGSLQPVLETLKILVQENVWFEVTNLVIPTYTDDFDMIEEMSEWLVKNIGKDYPLHFSRFFPAYKLKHLPPTPYDTLKQARDIALDAGLKYVYIVNVPGLEEINTFCPHCEELIIERKGFLVTKYNLQEGACNFCGESIAGVWE